MVPSRCNTLLLERPGSIYGAGTDLHFPAPGGGDDAGLEHSGDEAERAVEQTGRYRGIQAHPSLQKFVQNGVFTKLPLKP